MYNWSDYVAPENIDAFKKAFAVDKFTYDTFASNEEMMAKLQGGAKASGTSRPRPPSSSRRCATRAS